MGALAASELPFFTSELGTSSGESPIVMKGPNHRNVVFLNEFKKHVDVKVIITHGMNVNEVRFY
jgi:hypothetical protein